MKKVVFCCVFLAVFVISFSAFAEREGGFQRENPFAPRNGLYIDTLPRVLTMRLYENGRVRMAYHRYRWNIAVNHDRLAVFNNGVYIIIRLNRQHVVVSVVTSDGERGDCLGDSEAELCQMASRIYQAWNERINFERYIEEALERPFLP